MSYEEELEKQNEELMNKLEITFNEIEKQDATIKELRNSINHKILSKGEEETVRNHIKLLLHAGYDCLRNRGEKPGAKLTHTNEYYCEAFGIVASLEILNYNIMKENVQWKLKPWLYDIMDEVEKEENLEGSLECDFCLLRYGKDYAGRTVKNGNILDKSGKKIGTVESAKKKLKLPMNWGRL